MVTIGIETSGRPGSVALVENGQVLGEMTLDESVSRHGQALIPTIKELLGRCNLSARDVKCVAVSSGPGSFTGIRVGVVCAKMFAYTTQSRLIEVSTFDAIAFAVPVSDGDQFIRAETQTLIVVGDAQRGGLFVSTYSNRAGIWRADGECQLQDKRSLLGSLGSDDFLVGPGLARYTKEFRETSAVIGDKAFWYPSAKNIALLAGEQGEANLIDPFQLQPLYVRASAAEEKRIR